MDLAAGGGPLPVAGEEHFRGGIAAVDAVEHGQGPVEAFDELGGVSRNIFF